MHRTSLYEEHKKLGARFVEFGGWEMPVWYTSGVAEHIATRTKAGLFDLGHMGRVRITGDRAFDCLQHLVTCDLSKTGVGRAKYGLLCQEDGNPIDDVLVHNGGSWWFVVVNAGNREADLAWMRRHAAAYGVQVLDQSAELAMLAIQGPEALGICQGLTSAQLATMKYYSFVEEAFAGAPAIVARTGYTGEDGFEVYFDADRAAGVWNKVLEAGRPKGLTPVGLAARDTLRLEAGMPLYGHEIHANANPIEAGLDFAVGFQKEFIGKTALLAAKEAPKRKLVGLEVEGKRVPRQGYPVVKGAQAVGEVTSGTQSPTLGKNIAMAYVPPSDAAPGTSLGVKIKDETFPARVIPLPFYKRERK